MNRTTLHGTSDAIGLERLLAAEPHLCADPLSSATMGCEAESLRPLGCANPTYPKRSYL
jgi:hypothetical protein